MTEIQQPDAVVFDVGNVLIEWQPERYYDATIGEDRRRAMFAALDLHGMNDDVDKGAHFQDTVTAFAKANPDWHAEIMMWHDNWLDMAQPAIPASVDALRALRAKGVSVFALSNFGIQTFEIAKPVYPFLSEFDRPYISGYMGVTKPDARIYQMVEEDCGLPPSTLLFADDRAENIDAAKARGWQTHLFDGPDGFVARLTSEGLI